MIYVVSLARIAKKALGEKAFTTSVEKLISLMPVDPSLSNMEGVILHSKDVNNLNKDKIQMGIDNAHPDLCIIYICASDSDKEKLKGVNYKVAKKVTPEVIKDAVSEFFGKRGVTAGHLDVHSKDDSAVYKRVDEAPVTKLLDKPEKEEQEEQVSLTIERVPESEPEYTVKPDPIPEPKLEPINIESAVPELKKEQEDEIVKNLNQIREFKDWNLLKQELNRNVMFRKLIQENAEFQGLTQMIDVIDKQVQSIYRDPTISAIDKFEQIKKTARELSIYRGTYNEVTTNRVLDLFTAILDAAQNIVDIRINEAKEALITVSKEKAALIDEEVLEQIIQNRTKTQFDLLTSIKEVISLYMTMDCVAQETITELSNHIPTSNEFINQQLRPLNEILTPKNTGELAQRILDSIASGRLICSQLEDKLQNVIDMIFACCEADESIIRYQQHLIELLKSNRVEDVVIVDSVIKHMMQVWIGPRDVGTTATVITWCGILSRRQNTLLIDLSGGHKLTQYGVEPHNLQEFLTNRIEEQLCVVEGTIHSVEGLHDLINEIKNRLNYYPYVHILLTDEQREFLDVLSPDAFIVNYISDSTNKSIQAMHELIVNHSYDNIARKMILIAPAINILAMCEKLGVDPSSTKVVPIPHLPIIEACALKGGKPFTHDIVINAFEEAFR